MSDGHVSDEQNATIFESSQKTKIENQIRLMFLLLLWIDVLKYQNYF